MFSPGDSSENANSRGQFVNWAFAQQTLAGAENVDWAALAQQWIQMKESHVTEQDVPAAPPPPRISQNHELEEQGEAPMEVVREDDLPTIQHSFPTTEAVAVGPSVGNAYRNQNEWSQPSWYSAPTVTTEQTQWQGQGTWPVPGGTWIPSKTVPLSAPELITAPIVHTPRNITPPIKPAISHHSTSATSYTSTDLAMDAAKRKTLPAWIREGLEKMEREKQKQMKRETKTQETVSVNKDLVDSKLIDDVKNEIVMKRKPLYDSNESDDSAEIRLRKNQAVNQKEIEEKVKPVVVKSKEELLEEWMLVVRRSLTEVLLEVTNEEILSVAQETLRKSKAKASSAQVFRKSALSTITGKLGLGAYADSDSENSETDNDDGDDKANQDSEEVCDSEDEIKESIRARQNAFKAIAQEIEMRVSEAEQREARRYSERNPTTKVASSSEAATTSKSKSTSGGGNEFSSHHSKKGYNRDSGETHPDKKYSSNGKYSRERASRFSDARAERQYNSIAAPLPPPPPSLSSASGAPSSSVNLSNADNTDRRKENSTHSHKKSSKAASKQRRSFSTGSSSSSGSYDSYKWRSRSRRSSERSSHRSSAKNARKPSNYASSESDDDRSSRRRRHGGRSRSRDRSRSHSRSNYTSNRRRRDRR